MGLEQLWTTFTASLPALKDAWPTVIGLVVIALASGFAAGRFLFGERIENLKSRIARRDEEIADYKAKLHGKSPDEVADRILALERRIAELQPLMLSERPGAVLGTDKKPPNGRDLPNPD